VTEPPTIRINLNSPVPAYRQIVDAFRVLLVEGRLPPGSRLPSVRRLAMELGVHFNTVGEANRTLAEEGWLDLRHGRGATVIERPGAGADAAAGAAQLEEFRTALRHLVARMRAAGLPPARLADELRRFAGGLKS
jgi:DNA-binding transcriptional regulator YhcF (GntR family)